jgi:uncharacterized membrane protein
MNRENMSPLILAGVLLGVGMGGLFDGIVLHQILQWHHMLTSAGYPPTSVSNLESNTLADGLFHAGTFLVTAAGLYTLWRAGKQATLRGSGHVLLGGFLAGWGGFNLVEGIVDHQLLQIHHVRPGPDQLAWDLAFLAWGRVDVGCRLVARAARNGSGGAGASAEWTLGRPVQEGQAGKPVRREAGDEDR